MSFVVLPVPGGPRINFFMLPVRYPVRDDFNFVIGRRFAYLGVPKCASSTIRECMFKGRRAAGTTRAEAMQCETRISVIRHPVARVVSAWQYGWSDWPFPEWWETLQENPYVDLHVYPYAELLNNDATEVYRIESIASWWASLHHRFSDIFPPTPHRANANKKPLPEDHLPYATSILDFYRADYELWLSIA